MATQQDVQLEVSAKMETIDELLDATDRLLENVVHHWSHLLFEARFREQIVKAWQEIDFPLMRVEIDENAFEEVGLAGAQRELKLDAISAAFSSFAEAPSVKKLVTTLGWLLSILGSLAGISKRVEQTKEFIEVIQKLIDSSREP